MQRFTVYFCKTLYMFQSAIPSIIRSSKLHIQRQVLVRPILLPAASPGGLAAGNSNGRASYRNKYIVRRCIFLVVLFELISDAQTHEC